MNVRIWWGAGGALLVAAALVPAPAHAESSYSALSSATAVDVTVANGDLPVVTVVEAAGPSAGTSLDSTGQGTAFASDPYPGTTVAELPGTAAGLSGLPIPPYPLFVATTSDDEPADYSQPGIELHATCASTGAPRCEGTSVAGTGPATVMARATVKQPSADHVVATALAEISSLSLPGDVTLSGARTSATVTLENGSLTRRSELTVSRLTVGSTQVFSIRDGTVRAAGSDVPVPFSELAQALKAAGVEAELFAASQTEHGVVAPVLRLATVLPGGPAVLTKPSRVVYTLGGADASIALGAFHAVGAHGDVTRDQRVVVPAGAGVDATPLPPVGAVGEPVAVAAAPAVAPALSLSEAPTTASLGQATPASSPVQPFDVSDVYLALVLCAAVWFGATQALRIFGVRFRWT